MPSKFTVSEVPEDGRQIIEDVPLARLYDINRPQHFSHEHKDVILEFANRIQLDLDIQVNLAILSARVEEWFKAISDVTKIYEERGMEGILEKYTSEDAGNYRDPKYRVTLLNLPHNEFTVTLSVSRFPMLGFGDMEAKIGLVDMNGDKHHIALMINGVNSFATLEVTVENQSVGQPIFTVTPDQIIEVMARNTGIDTSDPVAAAHLQKNLATCLQKLKEFNERAKFGFETLATNYKIEDGGVMAPDSQLYHSVDVADGNSRDILLIAKLKETEDAFRSVKVWNVYLNIPIEIDGKYREIAVFIHEDGTISASMMAEF